MARVTGRRELRLKLAQVPKEVVTAAFASLDKSADELMQLQRRLVPEESGALRASIRKEQREDESRGIRVAIIAGGLPSTQERSGSRGKVFDRAVMMEHGTKPHKNLGLFKGSRNPGIKARPFFFPPYRAFKKTIKSRTSRAISAACKKVARQ